MSTITVTDMQRDLSAFLQRVEAGESFVLVRDERPLAEIRPLAPASTQLRPFGLCAGQFTVPDDVDKPLPVKVIKEFEGA